MPIFQKTDILPGSLAPHFFANFGRKIPRFRFKLCKKGNCLDGYTVYNHEVLGLLSCPYSYFFSNGHEYELNLQSISEFNLVDSSVIFPEGYIFSPNGCWEISFDLAENLANGTYFDRPELGTVSAISVMRTVERAIRDHYNEYKAGMYVFLPDNDKLEAVYKRLVARHLGRGFTIETGLDPDRRGYVLRTPKCY